MARETKNENVLLLNMSTLNNLKCNGYYYEGKNGKIYQFSGVSQLEAGTKLVLTLLQEKGEKLDRIVIMASAEANKKGVNNVAQYDETCSAVEFYQKRIEDFCKDQEDNSEYLKGNDMTDDVKALLAYKKRGKLLNLPDIRVVLLDNDNPTKSIMEIIHEVTGGDGERQIYLYIDMQGGNRNVTTQTNATVELLKEQNVVIKGRYAISFTYGNMNHPMSEVSEQYRVYDLITAMQIFRKYGRADELIAYFSTSKDREYKEGLEKYILPASEAIQLCDMLAFDEAIEKIRKWLKQQEERMERGEQHSQFDIVFRDIKADYKELLEDNEEYKYIKQIRWCLKKGFIQQAITLVESKMPYEYVKSGLVYYATTEDSPEELKAVFKKIAQLKACKKNEKDILKEKAYNHFYIRYYGFAARDKDKGRCNIACYIDNKERELPIKSLLPNSAKEDLINNLELLDKLSRERNNLNHASISQKRMSLSQLKEMTKKFIDDFEILAESVKEKRKFISILVLEDGK